MYTSSTRLTGLASGTDTDSYVKQMIFAKSTKYFNQQRKLQKLQWKQTAYREKASKISDFQKKWLDATSSSSMRLQRTFNAKFKANITTADGTESTNIKVTGMNSGGSHTIEVESVASAAKLQGSSVVSGKLDTSAGASSFTFSYKDGDAINIDVAQGSTDEQAAAQIKEKIAAGLGINTAAYENDVDKALESQNLSVDVKNGVVSVTSSIAGRSMKLGYTGGGEESTGNFQLQKASSKTASSDKLSSVIGTVSGTTSVTINDKSITIDNDMTVSEFVSAVNNSGAGVKMSYNSVSGSFTMEATETGSAGKIDFGDDASKAIFSSMGLDSSNIEAGKDAVVLIDGVRTESTTNSLKFDEFTADISNASAGQKYNISSSRDTDALASMISDFVKGYNELISGIRSTVTESRVQGAKGYYEPLTDEEKKEMKEADIEKWETEAKKGILNNDQILKGFLSDMRTTVYSASTTDKEGNNVGIYNMGITTTSYMSTAGELSVDENKLKEWLEKDPDAVISNITKIADGMNDTIKKYTGTNGKLATKAGIEGTSSEFTNTLYSDIKDLKSKMSTEMTRLKSLEEKYYKMFSAMEDAVSKNNSNLDALASM